MYYSALSWFFALSIGPEIHSIPLKVVFSYAFSVFAIGRHARDWQEMIYNSKFPKVSVSSLDIL